MAIASTHPDKALRTLEALKRDSNTPNIRDKAKTCIALMLVTKDPDKAIQIVRSCTEDANRAQAIGWLCGPVSRTDKHKAWQLIDEALEIHRGRRNAYRSWSNFGGAGPPAARLAHQAMGAGYPDMESIFWHVRAACRARTEPGMQRLTATVKTAKVLALVDRIASRELLNAVGHQVGQLGRAKSEWQAAWILTDFHRGSGMIGEQLEADAEKGKLSRAYPFDLLMQADSEELFRIINGFRLSLWQLN